MFPYGTPVRVISGPCAGRMGSVVGIDVGMVEFADQAVLTVDLGEDHDESLLPDVVEVAT